MNLNIKNIKYSHRNGFSAEFHPPQSITLELKEALVLVALIKGLFIQRLDPALFPINERPAIDHFFLELSKHVHTILDELSSHEKINRIPTELKNMTSFLNSLLPEHLDHFISQQNGWSSSTTQSSYVDNFVQDLLDDPKYTAYDFEKILSYTVPHTKAELQSETKPKRPYLGPLSPSLLEEVEKRFGPINRKTMTFKKPK